VIIVFAETRNIGALPALIKEVPIRANPALAIHVLFTIAVRLDYYAMSSLVVLETCFTTEALGILTEVLAIVVKASAILDHRVFVTPGT
jgi:hypothetical protein